MDSFYGGHQGTPFIIKHAFESEDDMIAAFSKGIAFKDVWFGEYCIIDTTNKNDPSNGRIYRRGTEYSQTEDADAVYIGQIVGPAGPAPIVEMRTVKEIIGGDGEDEVGAIKDNSKEKEYQVYPIEENEIYYDDEKWESGTDPEPATTEFTIQNGQLVNGKTHPSIEFAWCNIKYAPDKDDPTGTKTNKVLVGFKIPYVVFEALTDDKLKSPYTDGKYGITQTEVEVKPISNDNPFYQQFKIPVYEGIQGISYVDFNVVKLKENDVLYRPEDLIYDEENACLLAESGPSNMEGLADEYPMPGYVVRVCAYDTYSNPKSSLKIDENKEFASSDEDKTKDDVDIENEPNPKPDGWKPRVRSVWLYLGRKLENGTGHVLFVESDRYDREETSIWGSLSEAGDDARVVTYNFNETVDSGIDTTNQWWTADYTGKGIITIPDSNQQPADDSGEASGGE